MTNAPTKATTLYPVDIAQTHIKIKTIRDKGSLIEGLRIVFDDESKIELPKTHNTIRDNWFIRGKITTPTRLERTLMRLRVIPRSNYRVIEPKNDK